MSENSANDGVIGDPLLKNTQVGSIAIEMDAIPYFYTAASYLPIIRQIRLKNLKLADSENELVVTVRAEVVGTNSIIFPWTQARAPLGINDVDIIHSIRVQPNLIELASLDESRIGQIIVEVHCNDQLVGELRQQIEFLAYNQWMHAPQFYASLAAFVLPNHPTVNAIMDRVRDRLLRDTGRNSTEGYQAGIKRVLEIAKAIFEELQAIQFKYSDPPASFEGFGQKIRTPDVVIAQNIATCLDSSALVASCLAAGGIDPLIFMIDSHAFPGFWLHDRNDRNELSSGLIEKMNFSGVIDNVNLVQTLYSQPFFATIESTNLAETSATTFADSFNAHNYVIDGNRSGEFNALIDPIRVSELGVRRLPNRTLVNGEIHIIDAPVAVPKVSSPVVDEDVNDGDKNPADRLEVAQVPNRVRRWMDALLDISNSNPLIHLNSSPLTGWEKLLSGSENQKKERTTNSIQLPVVPGLLAQMENRLMNGQSIQLVVSSRMDTNLLNEPRPERILEIFSASGTMSLNDLTSVSRVIEGVANALTADGNGPAAARQMAFAGIDNLLEKEATRRIRALKKNAEEVEANSASNQLYLTVGTLIWETPGEGKKQGKVVHSPLFLIPIRLTGSVASSISITLEVGTEIVPNYCLMEKLRSELGLRINELETPELDDSGIDVDRMVAAIRQQLGDGKHSSMRVEQNAQLAVLDFATFRMWKDLRDNWKTFTHNRVVNHLINTPYETFVDDVPAFTGEPLCPIACDESQMLAVKSALEGRSFVLEGPPGTGKSQTIANLISAAMAEGKKVLFVAEKQTALNAVSKKLDAIGLSPFCITMHHESTTTESISQQLKVSLDYVGEDLSQQWSSETAVLSSLREANNRYRDALVERNEIGVDALLAHQETLRLGEGPALDIRPDLLARISEHRDDVRKSLLEIRQIIGSSRMDPNQPWSICTLTDATTVIRDRIGATLESLSLQLADAQHLSPIVSLLLTESERNMRWESIKNVIEVLAAQPATDFEIIEAQSASIWLSITDTFTTRVDAFKSLHKPILDFFQVSALNVDLTPQITAAAEAMAAGMLSRKKKYETLKALLRPLTNSEITIEAAEIVTLLQRVAPAREEFLRIQESARSLENIEVRQDFDPFDSEHLLELKNTAQEIHQHAVTMMEPAADIVRQLASQGTKFGTGNTHKIQQILETWSSLTSLIDASPESIEKWCKGMPLASAIVNTLPSLLADAPNFLGLTRWINANNTLQPLRRAGFDQLVNGIIAGEISLENLFDEFERGVARTARQERLSTGVLSGFDRLSLDLAVANLARRDFNQKSLMRTVIPRQLSEKRPFKPGVRIGEIGKLESELSRKVRRVSIPKLIQNYGEIITTLTPCFLMSPEAVSRLLPADSQFFDIVVFDEASQIRVASAIPAMGRGKSVIVVGDTKQMPPSIRVGKKSASDNTESEGDEEETYKDLESILSECSESNLPKMTLKCHFRSQHEALISFSNRKFYNNELVTFPAPDSALLSPIYWHYVDGGQFERIGPFKGSNPIEADQVVAEIVRRLEDPSTSGKSIGVVTFNETQKNLIIQKLEALGNEAVNAAIGLKDKARCLFVVPLEKVQGDERDTIILSVGYSYQDGQKSKVSPTWGPLINDGGERRLNVAITRAVQDMVVFCSFDPNHVSAENATFDGAKLTKEFLQVCRDSSVGNGASLRGRDVTSKDYHRRAILDQLKAEGIHVVENVGLSKFRIDLAVSTSSTSGQFLAIVLDGLDWASRSTPYDRDILPDSTLRTIGWRRTGRVWLKSVIEEPQLVLATVKAELRREQNRVDLKKSLEDRGFEIGDSSAMAMSGIDLAVRRKGQRGWPIAIALNGPDLFRQLFSYDGEKPPTEFLKEHTCVEAMSIWLPDLTANLEQILTQIEEAVERASAELEHLFPPVDLQESREESATQNADIPAPDRNQMSVLMDSELRTDFVDASTLPKAGDQSLLGPGPAMDVSAVRRAASEIVETEGPIIESRLASLLVGRFGMSAVKKSRAESLQTMYQHLTRTTSPFGVVFWSDTRPVSSWIGYRTCSGEITRTIDEVSAEELSNAMVDVVRLGASATEEQIIRQVALAYGRKAVTGVLKTKLTEILQWTVTSGRLVIEADLIRLPN